MSKISYKAERAENFFYRIIYSFFSAKFYKYVILKQNKSGFSTILILLFISAFVPSLIISNKLSNFSFSDTDNQYFLDLKDNIITIPEFQIREGVLVDKNTPISSQAKFSNKNIIVVDPNKNSINTSNAIILFAKDGIYFSSMELVVNMLRILDLRKIEESKVVYKENYIKYLVDDADINGGVIVEWIEEYINILGGNILFYITPIIFIFITLLKLLEIFILSLIARIISLKNKIELSSRQYIKIANSAILPTTTIKTINAIFLWPSFILANSVISMFLITGINIYFILYSLRSLKDLE